MAVTYKYLKNSNNGDLIKSQEFHSITITSIPVYYYDCRGYRIGENLELKGYVEISEKKFNRECKKQKK